MAQIIRMHQTGGPEVMRVEDVNLEAPGPGMVLLNQTAIGLNYIDTYHRSGLYPLPLPITLGLEGAGVVDAVGPGVTGLKPGDRVVYCNAIGAYAARRLAPAAALIPIPAGIDDRTAAAALLKGLTVEYLLRRTYPVQPGDVVVFHAIAGGVGLIAAQWAKHLGVTVIGTVSSDAKAELARAHGCPHVVVMGRDDLKKTVRDLTGGKGVPVVYDGVGKDTFFDSLDLLRPRGLMVSFGNASGPPPAIELGLLNTKGSLFVTRPSLAAYVGTRPELLAAAEQLFAVMRAGAVSITINQTYALREVVQAHRDLEGRKTTGSTVLLP